VLVALAALLLIAFLCGVSVGVMVTIGLMRKY
jgi:hypothetical protein